MKQNLEMRKSERIPFKYMVRYGVDSPKTDGFSYDLSAEGMGVFCERPLERGTVVTIDIMYDSEVVRVKGQVRWSHGQKGMNVRAGFLLTEIPERLKEIYQELKTKKRKK